MNLRKSEADLTGAIHQCHWISGLNSASAQRGRSLTFDPRRVNHADKWHSQSGLLRIPQSTTHQLSMTLDFMSIYTDFSSTRSSSALDGKSHPSAETMNYSKRGVTMIDDLPDHSGRKTIRCMEHTHTHQILLFLLFYLNQLLFIEMNGGGFCHFINHWLHQTTNDHLHPTN